MLQLLKVSVTFVFLSLALSPAVSYAQSKTPSPAITVYKTPT